MIIHKCDECGFELPAKDNNASAPPSSWIKADSSTYGRVVFCSLECVEQYGKLEPRRYAERLEAEQEKLTKEAEDERAGRKQFSDALRRHGDETMAANDKRSACDSEADRRSIKEKGCLEHGTFVVEI